MHEGCALEPGEVPTQLVGRLTEMTQRQIDGVLEPTHVVVVDLAQGGDEPLLGWVLPGHLEALDHEVGGSPSFVPGEVGDPGVVGVLLQRRLEGLGGGRLELDRRGRGREPRALSVGNRRGVANQGLPVAGGAGITFMLTPSCLRAVISAKLVTSSSGSHKVSTPAALICRASVVTLTLPKGTVVLR